jgi:large subunit ribosomal protein L29
MKVSKLREKSVDELRNEEQDLYNQLFKLRFQKATGQLDNTSKITEVRKDLARVKTLLTEKQK